MNKGKRTFNATLYPYFVSLYQDEDTDSSQLLVYNVSTAVQKEYPLWSTEDLSQKAIGIYCATNCVYIVTNTKLFKRRYFEEVNE